MSHATFVRPEDVVPDGVESVSINGVKVRKGSIAAFLANIEIFENPDISEQGKLEATKAIKELAPAVVAVGLHKHVVFKNKHIEKMLNDAEQLLK